MNERPAVNRLREAMRNALIASALATASPAHACHHYSRWYYPTPQPRCSTGVAAHTTREADHSWYVEFVLPERVPDEREHGIETLKTLLADKP